MRSTCPRRAAAVTRRCSTKRSMRWHAGWTRRWRNEPDEETIAMKRRSWIRAMLALIAFAAVPTTRAADAPTAQQHDWVARNFRFHTGEVLPEVRIHYVTIGAPTGEPVLVLHGTAQ